VLLVTRDDGVGPARFGIDGPGAVYTRTGRSFFDGTLAGELLAGLRAAVTAAGLWDELETGWLLLDAELLPWSAKAAGLIREQYAAVGAAALTSLPPAGAALAAAAGRGVDVGELAERISGRHQAAAAFDAVHRRYTWPTDGLDGVRIAPFQVLAAQGRNLAVVEHEWHLGVAARLATASELFAPTRSRTVEVGDPASVAAGTAWWEELTAAGGEGMVVKPAGAYVRGKRSPVQPGLKVRGREYLRLIYGPDYTEPQNLSRVRRRRIAGKRSLALREYALGLEALDRLAAGEPLWRVHECVFAVLALESEPVDPRL
jgi:hypothetical protein